jgi:hypothetical protein
MKLNDQLQESLRKVEEIKKQIANCAHNFDDPKYDPETERQAYGYKMEKQGSDVWGVPEGYKDVQVPRWSRECLICGHKEYTKEQETVSITKKPKF